MRAAKEAVQAPGGAAGGTERRTPAGKKYHGSLEDEVDASLRGGRPSPGVALE